MAGLIACSAARVSIIVWYMWVRSAGVTPGSAGLWGDEFDK